MTFRTALVTILKSHENSRYFAWQAGSNVIFNDIIKNIINIE